MLVQTLYRIMIVLLDTDIMHNSAEDKFLRWCDPNIGYLKKIFQNDFACGEEMNNLEKKKRKVLYATYSTISSS